MPSKMALCLILLAAAFSGCKRTSSAGVKSDTEGSGSMDPVAGCESEWTAYQNAANVSSTQSTGADDAQCTASGGIIKDKSCQCRNKDGGASPFDPKTYTCDSGTLYPGAGRIASTSSVDEAQCRASGGVVKDNACNCMNKDGGGGAFDPKTYTCDSGTLYPGAGRIASTSEASGVKPEASGPTTTETVVAAQDHKTCEEQGGTWKADADPANGCQCPSGMWYGNFNIRNFCKNGSPAQKEEACTGSGGKWFGSNAEGSRCGCSPDGSEEYSYPPAEKCEAAASLALTGGTSTPRTMPAVKGLSLTEGSGGGTTADRAKQAYYACKTRVTASSGRPDMSAACKAAGGFLLGTGCLCEEGRTVSDASVLTPGSCTAPSLRRVCEESKGMLVENGTGCKCGVTTRYRLDAMPSSVCKEKTEAQTQSGNPSSGKPDMATACRAAGGFQLGNSCLCEEGRTVSDASVLTAGSCTAPSLKRVCDETKGTMVENNTGCKCGGTTRYRLDAMPNSACTERTEVSAPPPVTQPRPAETVTCFIMDVCVQGNPNRWCNLYGPNRQLITGGSYLNRRCNDRPAAGESYGPTEGLKAVGNTNGCKAYQTASNCPN